MRLTFQPLTPKRWPDLEKLFGERGACGGCWCMAWRLQRAEYAKNKGARNKSAFRKIVAAGEQPGVLAYLDGQPVGWCAVAPRQAYSFLDRSRVLARIDEKPVWSISCLFVAKPYRKRGVSVELLRAAAAHAASRGARVVEGYPVVPGKNSIPDVFAWTGTLNAFRRAGFGEAARRSAARPIMRFRCDFRD